MAAGLPRAWQVSIAAAAREHAPEKPKANAGDASRYRGPKRAEAGSNNLAGGIVAQADDPDQPDVPWKSC
jgi:hypothetical protein